MVARQNGKTLLLQVKALYKLFVDGAQLVIGTAQTLDVAEEAWNGAIEIVQATPELSEEVEQIYKVNGKKSLTIAGGGRWKIAAASRRGGRGLSGDDVNMDELREHQKWDSWAAVTKTTMARPRAQVWAYSNAGDDASVVLNHLQAMGRAAIDDLTDSDQSFGLFEWSAPEDCDPTDRDVWPMSNPSLGYTITEDSLAASLATDPPEVFRTEALCLRVTTLVRQKLPPKSWLACLDHDSRIDADLPVFALEVAWDRSYSAICAAGPRLDGLSHVELIAYQAGTDWVVPWLEKRMRQCHVVVVDRSAPGGSLLTEMVSAGLRLKIVGTRDHAQACGALYDAVVTEQIRHIGQEPLNVALSAAVTRQLSDVWVWDRKQSPVDISPITAATLALWGTALYPLYDLIDTVQ
jgi:hypothetical protein